MDVRAFGSWMSAPKCLLFQDFEGLTEVLPLDFRRDIRVDVRGISDPKLTIAHKKITELIPNNFGSVIPPLKLLNIIPTAIR